MGDTLRRSASTVASLPPLTMGNLTLALLGLPLAVFLLGATSTDIQPITTIGIYWLMALVVVGIAVWGEKLSLADLGFRRPALVDLGYALVTSVGILLVYSVTPPVVEALGLPVSDGAGVVGAGVGLGMALLQAVTIGVVEEILYRGYPIERLLAHTESTLVAGGITWLLFTAAHAMSWPLGNLLQTALVAAVLTVVYLRRRTLAPVVGAHVLVWAFAALGQFYG